MRTIPTVPAKGIIHKLHGDFNWFGAAYNMNIYKGCSHGCIYCDSRADCYRIEDFDTVKAKENAKQLVRNELRRFTKPGVVASGAMTDPYNPIEAKLKLTRYSLEQMNTYRFGASLCTKSHLIARDIDVLCAIKEHSPVIVHMSVTCDEDDMSLMLEPHVAPTTKRFEAMAKLSDAGIFCGVFMMPILPYINDDVDNIVGVLRQAKEAGARYVFASMGSTLRDGNREYFFRKLDEQFPGVKQKYARQFGNSYNLPSPHAKKLWHAFNAECLRLGLLHKMCDITQAYQAGYGDGQLRLF